MVFFSQFLMIFKMIHDGFAAVLPQVVKLYILR